MTILNKAFKEMNTIYIMAMREPKMVKKQNTKLHFINRYIKS